MNNYKIEITETLSRIVEIDANNQEEANHIATKMYKNEEIILDSSDVNDFTIKKMLNVFEGEEKDELIAQIVDYLYHDEKKHFEEFGDIKPTDHIFLKLKKIKKLI